MSVTEKLFDKLAERLVASNERVRGSIESGFAQTTKAVRVGGARYAALSPGLQPSGRGRLAGWSLEGGATDGVVRFYDGRSTDADPVAVVKVAAGATSNHAFPGPGVFVTEALFVAVTGGVTGTLFFGAVD